jgi:hypothetical protein
MFGTPGPEHLLVAERELTETLARLRPPVDVLSDIRELETLEAMNSEGIARVVLRIYGFGVRKIVRVVGKSAAAAVQMERFSRQLKGPTAHLAFSMEEAEQVLSR